MNCVHSWGVYVPVCVRPVRSKSSRNHQHAAVYHNIITKHTLQPAHTHSLKARFSCNRWARGKRTRPVRVHSDGKKATTGDEHMVSDLPLAVCQR